MEGTVNLAMEPEERTILENISSLIQQLLSMQGTAEEPMIEEAMPPEESEMNKAMQDETGDDKAEDRLNNQTDVTDESMTDLKKNLQVLTQLLGQKRTVQKSITNDPVLNELKTLNQTLQNVIKTQQSQDEFNHNIMQAMGVADDVVAKTLESSKQPRQNRPIQGNDMALFAQEFAKNYAVEVAKAMQGNQVTQNRGQHPFQEKYYDSQVNKDMCKVVDFICKKGVA